MSKRNFGEYSIDHFYKENASENLKSSRFKIGVLRLD